MRVSGALVLLGILLFGFQVGFSDGVVPRIAPLPIGVLPLQIGAVALLLGLVWGLITGSAEYRVAIGLAILGTAFIFFGITLVTTGGFSPDVSTDEMTLSGNEMAVLLGGLMWLVAVVIGAHALGRSDAHGATQRRDPLP